MYAFIVKICHNEKLWRVKCRFRKNEGGMVALSVKNVLKNVLGGVCLLCNSL